MSLQSIENGPFANIGQSNEADAHLEEQKQAQELFEP